LQALSGRRLPQASPGPKNAPDFSKYDGKYEVPLEKESHVLEVDFVAIGSMEDPKDEDEDDKEKDG
jgi:hypothetical protein